MAEMKIYVCGRACYKEDLYALLKQGASDASIQGTLITIENSGCLGGCTLGPRIDVQLQGESQPVIIKYGCKEIQNKGKVIIHDIGDDPLTTIIKQHLPNINRKDNQRHTFLERIYRVIYDKLNPSTK